ncbi:hypothetical protein VDS44_21670, partial [Xanthomonas campestris pv. campestris]|nr:hypothetical protein [Xanthomonas campestris pv. campestris]
TSQQRSTLQPRALSVITGTDDGGRSTLIRIKNDFFKYVNPLLVSLSLICPIWINILALVNVANIVKPATKKPRMVRDALKHVEDISLTDLMVSAVSWSESQDVIAAIKTMDVVIKLNLLVGIFLD